MFIEGVAGMGKTTILNMLREEVLLFPDLKRTVFVTGYCYENISICNTYQPFIDILEEWAVFKSKTDNKRKKVVELLTEILKETAPDWLQIVLGPFLSVGVKVTTVTRSGYSIPQSKLKRASPSH